MGFFSDLFGPSRDEIWRKIAADLGGRYEEGGFLGRDVLRYRSGEWEICLDLMLASTGRSTSTMTRMRAPFVSRDGFRFKIYRAGLFSALGTLAGLQDIRIGDKFFDETFVIQGNDPGKVKRLLKDPKLRKLIKAQPDILFQVLDDEGSFGTPLPDGVDELQCMCDGSLKDETQLRQLFDLFCLTLGRLVELDTAAPTDPGVKL